MTFFITALLISILSASPTLAGNQLRSKGFKIGSHQTGEFNNIADVQSVTVGHATLIQGEGKLKPGKGPVRTGVTVVVPKDVWKRPLSAGVFTFNGVGEAMGFANVSEMGVLQTPVALTNTLSVSDVQKALAGAFLKKNPTVESIMPVVMECDDSSLNDIQGYHVQEKHVVQALANTSRKFDEGSVGAGTGMISFDFKSGIGSSSRVVEIANKPYTIGVLVNSNIGTGTRSVFRLLGVEVAKHVTDLLPIEKPWSTRGSGSIVTVIATDAPLDSRQLGRLAKRSHAGVFRLGTPGYNGSGDFTIAFSTVSSPLPRFEESELNSAFEAVADATEEAVINSMLSSQEMIGRDGNRIYALPFKTLKSLIRDYR